jgi:hypothetical protein
MQRLDNHIKGTIQEVSEGTSSSNYVLQKEDQMLYLAGVSEG